jgi:hypothetical protein
VFWHWANVALRALRAGRAKVALFADNTVALVALVAFVALIASFPFWATRAGVSFVALEPTLPLRTLRATRPGLSLSASWAWNWNIGQYDLAGIALFAALSALCFVVDCPLGKLQRPYGRSPCDIITHC